MGNGEERLWTVQERQNPRTAFLGYSSAKPVLLILKANRRLQTFYFLFMFLKHSSTRL